jgi:hypothetical protein
VISHIFPNAFEGQLGLTTIYTNYANFSSLPTCDSGAFENVSPSGVLINTGTLPSLQVLNYFKSSGLLPAGWVAG